METFSRAINIMLISLIMFGIIGYCTTSLVVYADVATVEQAAITNAADTVNTADTEKKEMTLDDIKAKYENTEIKFHIGVSRDGERFSSNIKYFNQEIISLLKVFFSFAVFIAVIYTGISTILKNQDGKARAEYIDRFKNIIFGVILFALIIVIANIATNFQQESMNKIYNGEVFDESIIQALDSELEVNIIARPIELMLNMVADLIGWLLKLVMNLLGGNLEFWDDSSAEFSINDAVFLAHLGNDLNLGAEKNDIMFTTAPFTVTEWDKYTTVYAMLSGLFIPFLLISLIKTSYELVIGSGNFERIAEAKKTILRIVVGIMGIVLGPYLFRLLLTIFNMLVFLIPAKFVTYNYESMVGNGIISLITVIWWRYINFRILLTMLVREIMLTVMYLATPIVLGIWTISDKFKSAQLWLGETLSNAATQFCYALTLFITTILLHGGQGNPFFVLLWLSMVIKIGNFFKDSLQGLLSRWGGIDESGIADSVAGKVKSWGEKATDTFIKEVEEDNFFATTRVASNAMGLVRFASTGDLSGFKSAGKSIRKHGKTTKQKGAEELSIASNLRRTGAYDQAIRGSAEAAYLDNLYTELGGLTDKSDIAYKKREIADYENLHSHDSRVATISQYYDSLIRGQDMIEEGNRIELRGKHIQKKNEIIQGTIDSITSKREKETVAYTQVYGLNDPTRRSYLTKKEQQQINNFNKSYSVSHDYKAVMSNSSTRLPSYNHLNASVNKLESEMRKKLETARDGSVRGYGNYYATDSYNAKYGKINLPMDKTKVVALSGANLSERDEKKLQDELMKVAKQKADIQNKVNLERANIDRAVLLQKESKDRSVTQDAILKNMARTNEAVRTHIQEMVDRKNNGILMPNDNVYQELDKQIGHVEINGDEELAKQLKEMIKVFQQQKNS